MKRVFVLLGVLAVLFACSQPEVETVPTSENGFGVDSRAMGLENQELDVRIESGCLVFKNFEVRDSIVNMLEQFSDEQRTAWEMNLGFVSAKTYYASYFQEYDNVKSEQECHAFAEKYDSILTITRDEEGCIDVEYPFSAPGLETILTADGRVKIGNAMYIYKENRRIVIHFADTQKINKYKEASFSSEENNVDVIYNADARIMLRGSVSSDMSLKNSGGFIKSGKKKYLWDLVYTWEKNMVDKTFYQNHTYLRLHQRAKKKYLGGWHDYSTTYSIHGTYVSVQGNGVNSQYYGDEHSIERKSGANYTFFHLELPRPTNYGSEGHAKISVVVRADHKSSFLDWPGYSLTYEGNIGELSETFVFSSSYPNKLYY